MSPEPPAPSFRFLNRLRHFMNSTMDLTEQDAVRRTRLHEVALRIFRRVVKDLLLYLVVLVVASTDQRLTGSLCAVVVPVGLLDPPVDQETQHVRGEIQRQHDEVE